MCFFIQSSVPLLSRRKDSPIMGGGKAKGKQARRWADGAVTKDELATLDYSRSADGGDSGNAGTPSDSFNQEEIRALTGHLSSDLADVEVPSDEEEDFEDDEEEEEEEVAARQAKTQVKSGNLLWHEK